MWLIKGVFYNFFYYIQKVSECTDLAYYQRNRDVILNRAKDYYQNDKERLREQARDKHRNLPEEKKIKRENMKKTDITICLKKKNKD